MKSVCRLFALYFLLGFTTLSFSQEAEGPERITITGQRIRVAWMQDSAVTATLAVLRDRFSRRPPQTPETSANPSSTDNSESKCKQSGNPVLLTTGEKLLRQADFMSLGAYGISLTRNYRSRIATGSLFGSNWGSSLDPMRISGYGTVCEPYGGPCAPASAILTEADGAKYEYTSSTQSIGEYSASGSESKGELTYLPGALWILKKNKITYTFRSDGLLDRIQDNTGTLLLDYIWTGSTLTEIKDTVGRSVKFTYTNGRVTSLTDPWNKTWQYGYDTNGMLSTVTSPGSDPDIRTYHYENIADKTLLTGMSINGARYSTYKYYTNKKVSESGLSTGEEVDKFTYGANQTTLTDSRGQATTYTYSNVLGEFRITGNSRAATTTCAAASASTVYDVNGYIDYTLDWKGFKTDYTYDAAGKLTKVTRAAGNPRATSEEYVWTGEDITSITYKDASAVSFKKVTYTYHASGLSAGRLQSETWFEYRGSKTRKTTYDYTFHPNGAIASQVVNETIPGGFNTTTYAYNAYGDVTSITDGVGNAVRMASYNALGLPGNMTDTNGIVTSYAYDDRGLLQTATQALPAGERVTTYSYNNNRQITDVFFPDGRAERYRYDTATKLQRWGNRPNEFVTRNYNAANRVETISSDRRLPSLSGTALTGINAEEGFSSVTAYDSLGRPRTVTGNNGQSIGFTYDLNGNVRTQEDAAGRVTTYLYGAFDRVLSVTAADGGVTEYTYDATGGVASVKDPRGLVTMYTYNGFGQVTRLSSPDTGVTDYVYDAAGRLLRETLDNGLIIEYAWDAIGRLTSRTSAGSVESFTYDAGTYGNGRMTGFTDASGSTAYAYSAAGELIEQVSTVSGTIYTTTWSYAPSGRLTGMTYPGGLALQFTHDASGRLTSVSRESGGSWLKVADSVLYQPAGHRAYAWRYGNLSRQSRNQTGNTIPGELMAR